MIRQITLLFFTSAILLSSAELRAGQKIWQDASPQVRGLENRIRLFEADHSALRVQLGLAPQEMNRDRSHWIQLPMPDGSLERFTIVESSIMQPALAARYPQIKTFKVYGVDDPSASGRVDITPQGFHAMLHTSRGRLFIDPDDTSGLYQSRYRSGQPSQRFSCGVHQMGSNLVDQPEFLQKAANRLEGNSLTYRLAVAATEEYVTAVGGTVAAAQAEIVTAINRVNEIYERDLGIRLLLVADNDKLIEQDSTTCLSNDDAFAILGENQVWTDSIIGSSKYDIGHVFSTGSGGLALLESVCDANSKAHGTTGLFFPKGDIFYIDFVAHEIGHQFSAQHSFNGTTRSCGVGRTASSAYEPGSGSTIMAYAGLCDVENIQTRSDATFHAGSIAQIDAFTGAGGSCYQQSPNGNSDPALVGTPDRTIPKETPFLLDNTSATDADVGDTLRYQWDQMDVGTSTSASSFGQDLGDNALFRSYEPQVVSSRDFPALGTQLQGMYDDAEVMACSSRVLNFRLTVRDNSGGQVVDDVRITVDSNSGPFRITSQYSPPTIMASNGSFTFNWNPANTFNPPISCATVDISLLTFNDVNYTKFSVHPIVNGTANDGTEQITITPATHSHPRARLRVSCSDNIFYNISDVDLVIEGTDLPPIFFSDTDHKTFFNDAGTSLVAMAPVCGAPRPGLEVFVNKMGAGVASSSDISKNAGLIDVFASQSSSSRTTPLECIPTDSVSSSGSSSGSFDIEWLIFITFLITGIKIIRRYNFITVYSEI
jgi:hypothetical protein